MTLLRPDTPTEHVPIPDDEKRPARGLPPTVPPGPADVVAAGVLCWRRNRESGATEVLLVHRPEHDAWGWPKGKPDRREGLAECAVREADETAGVVVVLGRPLPVVRYRLADGRVKEVSYWAARVIGQGRPPETRRKVDLAEWVDLDVAAERLTHDADLGPLDALASFAESGTLATTATLIIRHATARPRDAWARADGERPLVASGKRQAMAMTALLQCWRPDQMLSSPWRRCMQTIAPYAAVSGVRVRTKTGLSEAGFRRAPDKARRHTQRLLDSTHGGALCTHRPVLEVVMRALRDQSPPEVAAQIPDDNPYLHPGEILVAHAVQPSAKQPRIVAVERHQAR